MKLKKTAYSFLCFLLLGLNINAQTGLAAGTKITMADDKKKNIETIEVGDKVLSFNHNDRVYEDLKVKSINKVMLSRLARIVLETGMQITLSTDYPIWAEKGWVSVDPELTKTNKKYSKIKSCEIGDFLLFYNISSTDYVELNVIQGILEPIQTYKIELEGEGAIVANGFLVGQ